MLILLALAAVVAAGVGVVAWRRAVRARRRLDALSATVAGLLEDPQQRLALRGEGDALWDGLVADVERLRQRLSGGDAPRLATAADAGQSLEFWIEAQPDVVLIHDQNVLHANAHARALFAAPADSDTDALEGRSVTELLRPAYRGLVRRTLEGLLSGGVDPDAEREPLEVQLATDGEPRWAALFSTPLDYQGRPALLTIARDITYRRSMEATLARGRLQARQTLESLGEAVITTDAAGRIDYMNEAAETLLGTQRGSAHGRALAELVTLIDEVDRTSMGDPVERCLAERRRINLGRRAMLLSRSGGRECPVDLTASPVRNHGGDPAGCVVLVRDVTELRGLTRQMSYQASHDALTGLLNRREFQHRLEEALASARANAASHVLCYLDLDRFKAVNDTCGHIAGDNMLRELAALIRDEVRDSDSVARLGGDEFGMLLVGCPLEKATQIAADVCDAVANYRFVWQDRIFNVGVSVGLIEIGHESGSVEDVLAAADSACYVAKQQGRGTVHVYSARDEAMARQRGEIRWLQQLQSAIKEERFELYTQSIISLSGRVPSGPAVEVLLRMRDTAGRLVEPGEFMQSAERYHLTSHIDRWVVQTTLAALGSGALRLPDRRSCAINLCGQTLGDEGFLEFVVECLDHTGVSPSQICFELTEASVITNLEISRRFISVLHGMGCQFALDDFGSGMGSFANLKTLALDYLKIDGAFTRDLPGDTVHHAMVSAVVELARTLNFKVVAEQLEDRSAFEAVRGMGVDFAQGFIVEKPHPLNATN